MIKKIFVICDVAIAATAFSTVFISDAYAQAPTPVTCVSGCISGGVTGSAVQVVDGTNGPVAVKPASTAAIATDKSLVVQLNPDSPGIITLGATVKSSSVPVTFATDQYLDPCMNPLIAKSSVPIAITTATTTQIVALITATAIYVCHYNFTLNETVTTANTAQFEYGLSTTCTSPTVLTGVYGTGGITAGIPIYITAGYGGSIFKTAASNGLCIVSAGAPDIEGTISYVQQ